MLVQVFDNPRCACSGSCIVVRSHIQFNVIYFNCAFSKLIVPKEGNITLATMPAHKSWVMARLSDSCSPSALDIAVNSRSVSFCVIQV
jgi:hypothetical protein